MSGSNLRAVLAADSELGAGNVLLRLAEHGADMDVPRVTFDTEVDTIPAWTPLSLGTLTERTAARAEWFQRHGIGRRDPVAIYVSSAADVFLNFFALTWLGAIPALMNGSMPIEIAAEYIRRLRCAGVLLDADHAALAELGEDGLGAPVLGDAAQTGTGDPTRAPAHYRHHAEDPVVIAHSSGTTRMPAAVVHSHQSLFAAVRAVRLTEPRQHGPVREMSAFPQAHTAGVIIMNEALCNGYELLCLSGQGGSGQRGAFAGSGDVVIDAIERWRPTAVYGFAVTWSELARHDLTKRDVSSVRFWSNTGDCAHEAHIRRLVAVGSHHAYGPDGTVVSVPGSRFNDTLGSSEMGYGGFGISHRLGTERYGRCVGKAQPFAEIILLDQRTGQEVPVGEVGMAAMKSPTLMLGYWNDSVATFRTRLNGYYLTGDLMYRDEDGYFYHVDRASDAVDLDDGNWLYTALSEERILRQCPDVRDCTVVAARRDDGTLVAEVLLLLAADADPALDRDGEVRAALGPVAEGLPLRIVTIPDEDIVIGPTGKVRKFLMRERLVPSTGAS